MRSTALVVSIAHVMLVTSPAVAALNEKSNTSTHSAPSIETELAQSYATAIEKLALLKQLRESGKETEHVVQQLLPLQAKIEKLDASLNENFETEHQSLIERDISETIIERHVSNHDDYKKKATIFQELLKKELQTNVLSGLWLKAKGLFTSATKKVQRPETPMVSYKGIDFKASDFKRSQQAFDPNNLGTISLRPDKDNKPKTSKQEFIQSGLRSSPQLQLTALGDFSFDQLEEASDPAYLAESDEIQLTQSIQDKAAELDHDAVKIYHWVRNNVEWLPTWGAIQDAELTLEAQRGNTMDIASLTISLLRASNIPARYVHGTIDVPVEAYNNWVGGFDNYTAAGDYASSGGIPTTSILSNGQVNVIRMEHVWVEAATDFQPSRGAINLEADTWVQLDPSFKQYEFQEGLDVVEISGLDMDQVMQDYIDSGTVNEAEGWATGFDPAIMQQAQELSQQRIDEHIATLGDPTVGDVIGGKKTIIKEYPMLPSSVQNRIVVIGTRYDKLPSRLQQKIEFAFQRDILGDLIDQITFPFAKLNNEKVTLSFKPANEANEQALADLIPDDSTDLNQLPSSIPSSIYVIPELRVDGQVVKSGIAMQVGAELPFITGIRFAGRGYQRTPREYKVIAGSYLNVNVFAGSVSPVKLERLQAKLEQTKTILESADQTQIASLTRDETLGDMFYAGGLAYYAHLLSLSYMNGINAQGYYQMAAGYGTIGYEPNVDTFFGQPRSITTGGVAFDIPLLNITANKSGDTEKARQFTLQIGTLSSVLEHVIPEQLFAQSDPTVEKPDAISAVKAIQKASSAGQKIYQITQENMGHVLPLLKHDYETINEITRALNSGKDVTTHTDAVSIPGGWSGFGYIIVDPIVGDGAYKISGGANGSFFAGFLLAQAFLVLVIVTIATTGPLLIAAAYASVVSIIAASIHAFLATIDGGLEKACFLSGVDLAFSIFSFGTSKIASKIASMLFGSIDIPSPSECLR